MSDVIVALIGAAIGGSFAIGAVFIQQLLRRVGKVRCVLSRWEYSEEGRAAPPYKFSLNVFNEMETGTGVRDVRVVFLDEQKQVMQSVVPKEAQEDRRVDALNFPPRNLSCTKVL